MAKKIDFSALKPILFQYGDKAALGVCAISALLLIGLGLLRAKNASSIDWVDKMKKAASSLDNSIRSAPPHVPDEKKVAQTDPNLYKWEPWFSSYAIGSYINLTENADTKRRNPMVLAIRSAPENFQLNYYHGLYYAYSLNPAKGEMEVFGTAAAGGPGPVPGPGLGGPRPMPPGGPGGAAQAGNAVKTVEPLRMVVAQCVFPMVEQVEHFKQAFRLNSQAELFQDKSNLPHPVGLDIYRCEVLPDGKLGDRVKLYFYDREKDAVDVAAPLADLFRRAMLDEESVHGLEHYVHAGMVTPLPQLANARYFPVTLASLPVAKEAVADPKAGGPQPRPGPGMPGPGLPGPGMKMGPAGPGGNAPPGGTVQWAPWKDDPQAGRFEGKFEPFTPNAEIIAAEDPKLGPGPGPGPGPLGGPGMANRGGAHNFHPFEGGLGGGAPGASPPGAGYPQPGAGKFGPRPAAPAASATTSSDTWRADALIRFIDVGVEPGKIYCYELQVRMLNPNYNKPTEVAFEGLAKDKELPPSPVTRTPTIKIPPEYALYAVDQDKLDEKKEKASGGLNKNDHTFLQIHRWFDSAINADGEPYKVGDWAVRERELVRRGDYIGQFGMITEVAIWNKVKQSFEIPTSANPDLKTKTKEPRKNGIPLDFVPPGDAKKGQLLQPLLVDFEGGRRDVVAFKLPVKDESAVDALILMPDGKLKVRNSRNDSDSKMRKFVLDEYRKHRDQAQPAGADSGSANGPGGLQPGGGGLQPGLPKR
jgi:hypothetical protein